MELPVADEEVVQQCQQEYDEKRKLGSKDAPDACFRFVWALVHSASNEDAKRGLLMAEALLSSPEVDRREVLYLVAVAKFRLKRYVEARRTLMQLLEESPETRQAASLKEAVDDQIVKEGLIGVGIGTAVVGAVAGIAFALLSGRRH